MTEFKDLTLREGSQVPDLEISAEQGRHVIDQVAALDVKCMELSFPRANERQGWYRHAEERGLRTAALARAIPGDIDTALSVEADEIEVIITSSDLQLEYALGKSREEARQLLSENVERVIDGGADAGATLMDAMRADDGFLVDCARGAVDAGAKHVTLADTTGSGTAETVRETIAAVADEVGRKVDVAVHTHDDMGVATANAVAGVGAGATRVDATVGGIGERAGNAPLEEVAVHLAEQGAEPSIDLGDLIPACTRVHEILDVEISPGKSVLGERAYRHESGLHTAAMLREPWTYMPFDPADYGGETEFLFGRETGRGAVQALLEDLDAEATDEAVNEALTLIQRTAEEQGGPLSLESTREVLRQQL